MSDQTLMSDCLIISDHPLVPDHFLMSDCPLMSDHLLTYNNLLTTDGCKLGYPTIQPSLINPKTLTKEPIQGIRPRNLPKDSILRFGPMSKRVKSLFYLFFVKTIDLTPKTDQKGSFLALNG